MADRGRSRDKARNEKTGHRFRGARPMLPYVWLFSDYCGSSMSKDTKYCRPQGM